MSTAIVPANTPMLPAEIEQVLVNGDLSKLAPAQRVIYYGKVCDSLGLNPLTKPFDYLSLNGKLVLYAKKDCTDQLRAIHGVSVRIIARENTDGVYVVTARATNRSGREDESIGAVPLPASANDKANAIMKAETKAKRRVTLSICGLGVLDETEIETIPHAHTQDSGDETGAEAPRESNNKRPRGGISFRALKGFGELKAAMHKQTGSDDAYYRLLREQGYDHADAIEDDKRGRDVYRAMAAELNRMREASGLRATLRDALEVLGEGPFWSILGQDFSCGSIDDALALDGDRTAELLRALKIKADEMRQPAEVQQ